MGKKSRRRASSRDAPAKRQTRETGSAAFLCSPEAWKVLCSDGYRPLTDCPEVQMCVGVYADLIASMTLHLMRNTGSGDVRVKNELSRKLDINPSRDMTHQTFTFLIVWTMLMTGNQVTVPVYRGGMLEDLRPMPPEQVSFLPDGQSYRIRCGAQVFAPDEVLHFALRPDPARPYMGLGFTAALSDVVRSLRQTNATRTALMQSPKPSIIVRVDGLTDELQTAEGRRKLAARYLDETEDGKPWFVPAEAMSVSTVRPLTINDLAIRDGLEIDKRSIAAIIGVPSFLVGIGSFNRDEFNWFLSTRVRAIARIVEQELTKKTLLSPELYWRFNSRSLLSYDLPALISAGAQMVDRMAMRRNEWRDWAGLPPDSEMDELLALENYIPADRLGDQKKLKGGETDGEDEANANA